MILLLGDFKIKPNKFHFSPQIQCMTFWEDSLLSSQMTLPEETWRQKWQLCQRVWVMLKWVSHSHVILRDSRIIYRGPFFLTDCLLGFFSVNVILLQTSLWKCHLATLFISSPALSSIIHHFPLDGSHTQGWSSSRAARTEVWLWEWRDGCSGCPDARVSFGLMFAQPWSPVIEDPLPLPTLQRSGEAVNHVYWKRKAAISASLPPLN